MDVKLPDPLELQSWLEWAGERVITIHVLGTKPSSYRSFWPDYPDDPFTAYGYTNERLRPSPPSAPDIALMDEILNLVLLIPVILQRRVINSRALINPLNGRYLYSWSKIAILIHSERRAVKNIHRSGLEFLSRNIPENKVILISDSFRSGPSFSP